MLSVRKAESAQPDPQVILEIHCRPGELEARLATCVDCYNYEPFPDSLDNLTSTDVYFGRGQTILDLRARIKQKTIASRRKLDRKLGT